MHKVADLGVKSKKTSTPRPHMDSAGKTSTHAARARAITLHRERSMNEIVCLRRQGLVSGVFIGKAQRLLTQSWSKATWRGRESILRTVDWLLRMEQTHPSKREGGTHPPAARAQSAGSRGRRAAQPPGTP